MDIVAALDAPRRYRTTPPVYHASVSMPRRARKAAQRAPSVYVKLKFKLTVHIHVDLKLKSQKRAAAGEQPPVSAGRAAGLRGRGGEPRERHARRLEGSSEPRTDALRTTGRLMDGGPPGRRRAVLSRIEVDSRKN